MLALLFGRILSSLLLVHSFHAVHISYGDLTITRDSIYGEVTFYKDDWQRAAERWYGHALTSDKIALGEREYLLAHLRLWANTWKDPIAFVPSIKEDAGLSITYRFAVRTSKPIAI